ncbi:hypothetical protein GA707_11795 [Nostocoides sp. F2B08]|uniref:hypothetical protein n=1 Tax=Nostocoides sp. F2B08 TaxID=2653936 RepID=UPI001263C740|nr:hypothetical protein [Tetrasphaera sp. F2B08]KAB7744126.1 hypothetical protein GA707_11795 [Tetrasphaera sp. F2B08]
MSQPVTIAALGGAAALSAIALSDAVTFALTGQHTRFSDDFGVNPAFVLGGIIHSLAYLAFAGVLWSRRSQVDGGSGFRRAVRRILTGALLFLAVGMSVHAVLSVASGEVNDDAVFGAVAGIALLLMIVGSVTLGLSLMRRRDMRLAAWTLSGILPAIGLTIVLGATGSPWAHPAYAEALVSFGLAFIGLAPQREPIESTRREATLSPARG